MNLEKFKKNFMYQNTLPETKFKFYFESKNCKIFRKKAFEVQNAIKTSENNRTLHFLLTDCYTTLRLNVEF